MPCKLRPGGRKLEVETTARARRELRNAIDPLDKGMKAGVGREHFLEHFQDFSPDFSAVFLRRQRR